MTRSESEHIARVGGAVHVEGEAWVVVCAEGAMVRRAAYRDIDEARAAAERLAEERAV